MRKKIILLLCLFFVLSSVLMAQTLKSRGVPAYPYFQDLKQTDGSTVRLILKGDGVLHWFETEDGEKVLRDSNGSFAYATLSADGDMIPSNYILNASRPSYVSANIKKVNKDIFFSSKQIDNTEKAYFGEKVYNMIRARSSSLIMPKASFPSAGSRTGLLILAAFSDVPKIHDAYKFYDIMNMPNYNGTGSFRDFYLENSYNKFDIRTELPKVGIDYVWVTLPNPMSFYGENSSSEPGTDKNPMQMVVDACKAADAIGVDFTKYDNDSDGVIDNIMLIHSGYGEEAGGITNLIWSHRYSAANLNQFVDGKRISDYITFPELSGSSGSNITNIGVLVHEFGHALGLPDYYDTDELASGGRAYGLGDWDLMAGGSWNNQGITPAQHCAYSKYFLNWIDIPVINDPINPIVGNMSIKDISSNKVGGAYRVNSKTVNEFFIIENRQQTLFNSNIPHHGMLVYHVDLNYKSGFSWDLNNVNADPAHPGMELLFAGKSEYISSSIPFPGTFNVTQLDDASGVDYSQFTARRANDPSFMSWGFQKTGTILKSISEQAGLINLYSIPFPLMDINLNVSFSLDGVNNSIIDLSDCQVSLLPKDNLANKAPIIFTLDKDGKHSFTDFPVGIYNATLTIPNKSVNGETVVFDSYYENIDFSSVNVNLSLKRAINIKFVYKYDGLNDSKIDFSNDEVEFVNSTNSYNTILNVNGECIIKNFLKGTYNVNTKISDKTSLDSNNSSVILSFASSYSNVSINSPFVIIPLILKKADENVKVYPNPTTGYVTIEASFSDKAIIRIFDMKARLVYERVLNDDVVQNSNLHGIDLSLLDVGIYSLLIIDGDTKISKRIVKR